MTHKKLYSSEDSVGEKKLNKIDLKYLGMWSQFSVWIYHPPTLPAGTLDRSLHRLRNFKVLNIDNHHSTMVNKLIQRNCCGLKANLNELLISLTVLCPSIICLQETFSKPSDN